MMSYHSGYGQRPAAPRTWAPREAWDRPTRMEPVPGTPFGLVYFGTPPVVAGQAIGSLVAGVAALVVAFVVGCFGLAGAADGWGAWVAGAFAVLAGFLGGAGIGLGVVGLRRTRRVAPGAGGAVRGRGLAVAGLVCGAVAVAVTLASVGVAIALVVTPGLTLD